MIDSYWKSLEKSRWSHQSQHKFINRFTKYIQDFFNYIIKITFWYQISHLTFKFLRHEIQYFSSPSIGEKFISEAEMLDNTESFDCHKNLKGILGIVDNRELSVTSNSVCWLTETIEYNFVCNSCEIFYWHTDGTQHASRNF